MSSAPAAAKPSLALAGTQAPTRKAASVSWPDTQRVLPHRRRHRRLRHRRFRRYHRSHHRRARHLFAQRTHRRFRRAAR